MDEKAIQGKIEKLMDQREGLEEKCDTFKKCEGGDQCADCDVFKKMNEIDTEIQELEDKLYNDDEEEPE